MYTLLICDDEFYTRKGILNELPLDSLSISKVIEADDGVDALEKVNLCEPDIVLTDVRMPRMNGIDMVYELRKKHPNCIVIFMSGYSDKEYLRSAIKLHAIHYVDKPIIIDELILSIQEAIQICDSRNTSNNIISAVSINELALDLTHKEYNRKDIDLKIKMLKKINPNSSYCVTIILKTLIEPETDIYYSSQIQQSIFKKIDMLFNQYDLPYIHGFKNTDALIIHLLTDTKKITASPKTFLLNLISKLSTSICNYPHFLSIGMPVKTIYNLHKSYNTAILSIQDNFFIGTNSITIFKEETKPIYLLDEKFLPLFKDSLIRKDFYETKELVNSLTTELAKYNGTLISNVKNIFLSLTLCLLQYAESKYVNVFFKLGTKKHAWEIISELNTLIDLKIFLLDCLNIYIDSVDVQVESNTIVSAIINFIETHISNPNLTVQMISDFLHLSPGYVRLIFKQNTETTINQYITELRIDKAKKDLMDIRFKISEVAINSGYEDNNYFSKVFRKHTGVSPSEYREGVLL